MTKDIGTVITENNYQPKVNDVLAKEIDGNWVYVRIARINAKTLSLKIRGAGKLGDFDHGSQILPKEEVVDYRFIKNLKDADREIVEL